jgi:hypothetical protein
VAWLVGQAFPVVIYPVLGLGILAVCVGIGLLIGAGIVARAGQSGGAPSASP